MLARCPTFRETAHTGAGRVNSRQRRLNRRQTAPVQTVFEFQLITSFHRFFRLPEADDIIKRFPRSRDLHQPNRAFTPLIQRLNPQTWALVIPAHDVLVIGKLVVELQQTEAFRVVIEISVELQLLWVIERTRYPFAVSTPHSQAIGVMNLRVNGVAHTAFVSAAGKHTGHRRDAQLLNIFTSIQVIIDIHHHALSFTTDCKFVRPGDTCAI